MTFQTIARHVDEMLENQDWVGIDERGWTRRLDIDKLAHTDHRWLVFAKQVAQGRLDCTLPGTR